MFGLYNWIKLFLALSSFPKWWIISLICFLVQVPALAPNRLALVVDGENCLDRLYGGFYSGSAYSISNFLWKKTLTKCPPPFFKSLFSNVCADRINNFIRWERICEIKENLFPIYSFLAQKIISNPIWFTRKMSFFKAGAY